MTGKKKAIADLKKGLEKFKADALSKGWEEDEVQEKIKEVYENFPWYKYNPPKKSWKSRFFNLLLFSFVLYLAVGAVLERNKRLKKRVEDYMFDKQLSYHTQRALRLLTLPIFKFYDISVFHDAECLINNPFKEPEEVDCTYCEGINDIPFLNLASPDITDMVKEQEPFVVGGVPNYEVGKVGFKDFKQMFEQNKEDLDEAICKIGITKKFTKVSDFFQKVDSEAAANEGNISIEWSNCHTYGTRFYRKLFPRPDFIAKESEIHFEKKVYMLQKNENCSIPRNEGKSYYLYQLQGESKFEMVAESSCSFNCTEEPITATITAGQIAVFPNSGWKLSFKTIGDGLNMLFLSSFS